VDSIWRYCSCSEWTVGNNKKQILQSKVRISGLYRLTQ